MEAVQTQKRPEIRPVRTAEPRVLTEKETGRPLETETAFHSGFQNIQLTERKLAENGVSAGAAAPMTRGAGPRQGPAQMRKSGEDMSWKPRKYGYYEGVSSELGESQIPWASHGRNTKNRFDEQFRALQSPLSEPAIPPEQTEAVQSASAAQDEMQDEMQKLVETEHDRQRQMLAERIAQRKKVRGEKA